MGLVQPEQIAKVGSEAAEKAALFAWAALNQDVYPDLQYMFAVPNGEKRDKITGARLKAQGVKRGVPDIWLPVPKKVNGSWFNEPDFYYHGIVIEMKVKNNVLSEDQNRYREFLISKNYFYTICFTWIQARDVIVWYLSS